MFDYKAFKYFCINHVVTDAVMPFRSGPSCYWPNQFMFNLKPSIGLVASWSSITDFSHIE